MFINQILTKLKSLVYSKSETDSLLNGKASSSHTHTKSQITDFPTIPSKVSQLTNDSGFITGVSWDSVSNKPSTFTPSSHTHTKSQISDFPAYGSIAGTICQGNDPRLSDARTPYFANGTWYAVGDDAAIGDHNVGGGLGVKALNNPTTRIDLCYKDDASNYKSITYDGTTLYMNGNCDYATSAGSASSASSATTAGAVSTSVADGSSNDLVYATMAGSDYCRISCGGTSDVGYLEIATGDNGNEPIYVRQYDWAGYTRTLTLLSENGNTQFPGTVRAPTFSGNLNGNCSGTAGSVAWGNVSGRPTALSQFTNDSGFITSADRLPIGSYIQFAGSQAPAGFLVCNGGAISRTTYSQLFAVIGTTYGSGDGSTTFNLPNLTDRFLQGSTTSGTVKDAGLPNITGESTPASQKTGYNFQESGAFKDLPRNDNAMHPTQYISSGYHHLGFDASLSNSIYGNSDTVQPPALTCLICIKY